MQFAVLSLCLTEARGDFTSILLRLIGDALMETSHNVTDIREGKNKQIKHPDWFCVFELKQALDLF